ncbi:MAG TPA: ABC transporter ATP-binding protein [Bacillota bacterium]|nr:ABC transporter ATP-binding protein [Bacillota bacterium]HQA47512.1 ABC transporter ATP-binding protein [Bacillota bacterium]HQD41365.1 ABC transporter ATP-binding protein [Bacillota bacterium]HZX46425.1 ABC transporter ATP-binding protein [Clostridia bacterium]
MKPFLEIKNITMKFGSLAANEDVSFTIHENEIVSLIGPNGAGKTTLFNCITGFYKPFAGRVIYRGRDITGMAPHEICRLGITRTFQIVKTLNEMTVEENVMTGAFLHTRSRKEAAGITREILDLTDLWGKKDMLGANLTIADRKRVEIARALATKPQILMLDECMAGLNQTEIKDVMNLCLRLKGQGLSLLIVEHIMEAIMPISDNIVVLNAGRKITEGAPQDVVNNEEVIKAYLGDRYHAKSKKS